MTVYRRIGDLESWHGTRLSAQQVYRRIGDLEINRCVVLDSIRVYRRIGDLENISAGSPSS